MLMGAACAKQDLNLQDMVHKNLKWIRPPTDYTNLPVDMDHFYNREVPEHIHSLPDVHRLKDVLKPKTKLGKVEHFSDSYSDSYGSYYSSDDDYYHDTHVDNRNQQGFNR